MVLDEKSGSINITFYINDAERKRSFYMYLSNDKIFKLQGPVVQKPIYTNPRLKVNQGVYFSSPRCCSTLTFGKTLHLKKSILKNKNKQEKISPKS